MKTPVGNYKPCLAYMYSGLKSLLLTLTQNQALSAAARAQVAHYCPGADVGVCSIIDRSWNIYTYMYTYTHSSKLIRVLHRLGVVSCTNADHVDANHVQETLELMWVPMFAVSQAENATHPALQDNSCPTPSSRNVKCNTTNNCMPNVHNTEPDDTSSNMTLNPAGETCRMFYSIAIT